MFFFFQQFCYFYFKTLRAPFGVIFFHNFGPVLCQIYNEKKNTQYQQRPKHAHYSFSHRSSKYCFYFSIRFSHPLSSLFCVLLAVSTLHSKILFSNWITTLAIAPLPYPNLCYTWIANCFFDYFVTQQHCHTLDSVIIKFMQLAYQSIFPVIPAFVLNTIRHKFTAPIFSDVFIFCAWYTVPIFFFTNYTINLKHFLLRYGISVRQQQAKASAGIKNKLSLHYLSLQLKVSRIRSERSFVFRTESIRLSKLSYFGVGYQCCLKF